MQLLYRWPLVLLVCIPIIILLYLLKQKAEDIPVSSIYLWREALKDMEAADPWEKLKKNLLMFIQILTVLLLILALASPYLKHGGSEYGSVILILDNSGSMNASYDGEKSRLRTAKEQAEAYADSLPANTAVSVLTGNMQAQIEIAGSRDRKAVKEAIGGIEATDLPGDLSAAAELADSMTEQMEDPMVVMFTDASVSTGDRNSVIYDLSSEGPNGAVDYVSHSVDKEGKLKVLARITNYGTEDIRSDVNLYIGDKLAAVGRTDLTPGSEQVIYFDGLSEKTWRDAAANGEILKVELNEKDYLDKDNIRYDKLADNQEIKAILISEQNVFLEQALSVHPDIELYRTTDVENIGEESFDLYIFDGVLPEQLPEKGSLFFVNPPEELPEDFTLFHTGGKGEGAYTETSFPGNDFIDGLSFGVGEYIRIDKPSWANSFLNAGPDSLGFGGIVGGRYAAVLAFDLHHSELPLMSEYPVMIYTLLNECTDGGMLPEGIYNAGDYVSLQKVQEVRDAVIVYPDLITENLNLAGKELIFDGTKQTGLYQLIKTTKEGKEQEEFAVNYPADTESYLNKEPAAADQGIGHRKEIKQGGLMEGRNLRRGFIIGVLVLLVLEWIIYIRRL